MFNKNVKSNNKKYEIFKHYLMDQNWYCWLKLIVNWILNWKIVFVNLNKTEVKIKLNEIIKNT